MRVADSPASPNVSGRHESWAARWGWLVITLAVLITYWPLSSFQYTVTHGDTLNCWLPWRWFISSCLQDGHFPLWNPHQQFGYPMHADLQGPSWYVEAIALGGTVGHTIYTLQALFLFYVIIGGVGMMHLVRTLQQDARIGLVIGVAYALGGFFTGHQMHFYAVISAAWLPWLFDAAIRMFRAPGRRNAAYLALMQGLLLTGGNHTFSIIGAYVLLALFFARAWQQWRRGGWRPVRCVVLWCAAAVVCAGLIGVGVLHAWWEVSPFLSRSGGLEYAAAAAGPITWRSMVSLIFPFASGTDSVWLGTDPTMGNSYMGAWVLPLAIVALFRRRSLVENVLLVVACLSMLAAFGDATPIHHLLWKYIPGMDLFRFPSYFRWFVWFGALVLAAGTLQAYWSGALHPRVLPILWSSIALIALGLGVKGLVALGPEKETFVLFDRLRAMDLPWRLVLGAWCTVPVITWLAIRSWRKTIGFAALLVIVVFEMGWNTSLAQWNTALSDIRPSWLHGRLSALSKGPVMPDMVPTSAYDDSDQRLRYLMHNTQDYLGGISRNGFNTFWLRNAMDLEVRNSALWNAMSRQPVVYLADSVVQWNDHRPKDVIPERDSGLVVLADGVALSGSRSKAPEDRLRLTGFDFQTFTMRSNTRSSGLLVLQQSHYPGWKVFVDGAEHPLLNVNIAAMAVEVPAGEHVVEFCYRKPIVPWLLAISLVTTLLLLVELFFIGPGQWSHRSGVLLLMGMVCWSLFGHTPKQERVARAVPELLRNIPVDASVEVHGDVSAKATAVPAVEQHFDRPQEHDAPGAAGTCSPCFPDRSDKPRVALRDAVTYWLEVDQHTSPEVRACVLDRSDLEVIDRSEDVDLIRLTPRSSPANWSVLYADPQSEWQWIHSENAFAGGCTIDLDDLIRQRDATLIIDVQCKAPFSADAAIVMERKHAEVSTDYRTFPIHVPNGNSEAVPVYATVAVDELWRAGEVLKLYVWSHKGDSLAVRDLRVRIALEALDQW